MAGQVPASIFEVPDVICRIYDPVREDTYRRLGLTTVCPTTTISAIIIDHVMRRQRSVSPCSKRKRPDRVHHRCRWRKSRLLPRQNLLHEGHEVLLIERDRDKVGDQLRTVRVP